MSLQLSQRDRISQAAALALERARRRGAYPLSSAQLRLWLIDRSDPGSPAYNVSRAFHLDGQLAVAALEAALTWIVERHAPLRTTFRVVDGEPMQIVGRPEPACVDRFDLTRCSGDERARETQRIVAAEAAHRFRLDCEPMLRTAHVSLGSHEHVLVFTLHHIAVDERSLEIFFAELREAYGAFVTGLAPHAVPLAASYAELAVRERAETASAGLRERLDYWKTTLAGATPDVALPYAERQTDGERFAGAAERVVIAAPQVAALRRIASAHGATPYMAYLTTFAALLYRFSGTEDVTIGTPITGRRRSEMEHALGFFSNAVALRIDLSQAPSFEELLGRVRAVTLDAFVNGDVPFDLVARHVARKRNGLSNPLFSVLFALQPASESSLSLPGMAATPLEAPRMYAKFDLTALVYESAESAAFELNYDVARFDRATIEAMVREFSKLLDEFVRSPGAALPAATVLGTRGPVVAAEPVQRGAFVTADADERLALEAHVRTLWETLLDRRPIGLTEDFFEIGGHSLLAFRLVERIEREIGVALPMASFFEEPTIAGIARALATHAAEPALSPLRPLRIGSVARPVIFFHGVLNGGAFYLRSVAKHLADRTVYAIPPHGVDGGRVPASFDEMARERLAFLTSEGVLPPYDLIGYCNGALVAMELGHRLVAAGHPAPHVIAIEADVDPPHVRRLVAIARLGDAFGLREAAQNTLVLRVLDRWNRIRRVRRARDVVALAADQWQRLVAHLARRPAPSRPHDGPIERNLLDAYRGLFLRYRPRTYPGRVSVLIAADTPSARARAARWREAALQPHIYPIEGDHTTSVGTRAETLARSLQRCLDA